MALIKVNTRGQSADVATESYGKRNRIINGDFRIWQRNTTGNVNSGGFGPDRWRVSGTDNLTLSHRTDFGNPYSLLVQSYSKTNCAIGQRIEALNCKDLAGQEVTISYYLRADYPAYHKLLLLYANAENNHGGGQTPFVNTAKSYSSNVVTQITHTFTMPANAANGIDVILQWYDGGAGAFNLTAFIWDIQLELGSTATPFERLTPTHQLAECQRYCHVVSQPKFRSGSEMDISTFWAQGSNYGYARIEHPREMYAAPSLSFPGSFNTTITGGQGGTSLTGAHSTKQYSLINVSGSGWSAGQHGRLVSQNSQAGEIYMEAEIS